MDESAKLQAERVAVLVEIREVDAELQRIDPRLSFPRSSDNADSRRKQAATLRGEAEELRSKWDAFEQSFHILRSRADLYKTVPN